MMTIVALAPLISTSNLEFLNGRDIVDDAIGVEAHELNSTVKRGAYAKMGMIVFMR